LDGLVLFIGTLHQLGKQVKPCVALWKCWCLFHWWSALATHNRSTIVFAPDRWVGV